LKYLTLLTGLFFAQLSHASIITYVFNTGANVLSPSWPTLGGASPSGTTGLSLGTTILSLSNGAALQTATLTGSSTLNCVAATTTTPTQCSANATSDTAGTGHASGLAVGNGRLEQGETLTINILSGFVATLVSFQVTAMVNDEQGFYNLGSGNVSFLGGNQPIDTITVNSGAFTQLTFGTPSGSGTGGAYTWALHSMTLDVTSPAHAPEPTSLGLAAAGLGAMIALARRRSRA